MYKKNIGTFSKYHNTIIGCHNHENHGNWSEGKRKETTTKKVFSLEKKIKDKI